MSWKAEQRTREILREKRLHTYQQDTEVWTLLRLAVDEIDRLRSTA